jgi:hypothetical protein
VSETLAPLRVNLKAFWRRFRVRPTRPRDVQHAGSGRASDVLLDVLEPRAQTIDDRCERRPDRGHSST